MAMMKNGWGKERKDKRRISYCESGKRWVQRAEAKVLANKKALVKTFNHTTSLKSVAPDIKAFRKSFIHTLYFSSQCQLTLTNTLLSSTYITKNPIRYTLV
jgi:hypothetical protein